MPDYVACTRAIKGGSFSSEPGSTRFLKVPDKRNPDPSHEINRSTFIEAQKTNSPSSSSKDRWIHRNHPEATSSSALSQRYPEFMLQHAKPPSTPNHDTSRKLKFELQPSPQVAASSAKPRIVAYHPSISLLVPSNVERVGHAGTDSAWARSWLSWGRPTNTATEGCVVVFSRGTSSGHDAFFISKTATKIKVLGGNQSDDVNISEYPRQQVAGLSGAGLGSRSVNTSKQPAIFTYD